MLPCARRGFPGDEPRPRDPRAEPDAAVPGRRRRPLARLAAAAARGPAGTRAVGLVVNVASPEALAAAAPPARLMLSPGPATTWQRLGIRHYPVLITPPASSP